MTAQWYVELFDNFGNRYEEEAYTRGTVAEVDFIDAELERDASKRILDIGCGTGRHSIELASRGYDVTGIDLSESMLAKAKENARERKVNIRFERHNAVELPFRNEFDAALIICEGAFPLMETDEMNYRILQGASAALKSAGALILTTLNGLFPLYHSVKEFMDANAVTGISKTNTFDLMTFRDHSTYEFTDDSGRVRTIHCNERYYIPSEITWLLKSAGFAAVEIFGCDTGMWSRSVPLTPDHFEMLVVARKE